MNDLFQWKMNRHKQSVVLDLESAAGRTAARQLALSADVLVENYRPGVAGKLGLAAAELCTANPALVYVSLSGFGAGGPWKDRRSYGPNIEAASSILARTGYRDGGPTRLGHALPDGIGGLAGALAALHGLRERDARGFGGWYDISQLETYAALSGEEILVASQSGAPSPPLGNRSRHGAIQGVFPCRGTDQWIVVRLADEADLARFIEVTGLTSLRDAASSPRNDEAIESAIAAYSAGRDRFDLARELQQAGLEAFPVLTPPELLADPHLGERGFFQTVRLDGQGSLMPGHPYRADPPLADCEAAAPRFGEHTALVMDRLLETAR
jgi:CoA:oxalate CoA-transferase